MTKYNELDDNHDKLCTHGIDYEYCYYCRPAKEKMEVTTAVENAKMVLAERQESITMEDVQESIRLMRKRYEGGQGGLYSAMCRLSLRMSEFLLNTISNLQDQRDKTIVKLSDLLVKYKNSHKEIVDQHTELKESVNRNIKLRDDVINNLYMALKSIIKAESFANDENWHRKLALEVRKYNGLYDEIVEKILSKSQVPAYSIEDEFEIDVDLGTDECPQCHNSKEVGCKLDCTHDVSNKIGD